MITVFLIGLPCSGKSLVAKLLFNSLRRSAPELRIEYLDDFPILWRMVGEDKSCSRHTRTEDNGIKITDSSFWEDLDKVVVEKVKQQEGEIDIVLVEFARSEYKGTLNRFPSSMLSRSLVVYLECPPDVAWKRNVARGVKQRERFISKSEMDSTFFECTIQEIEQDLGLSVIKIENGARTKEELRKEVESLLTPMLITLALGSDARYHNSD